MVKNPSANAADARDVGTIPQSGRSPGERNGKAFQYPLENPMDRGAWQATVQESDVSRARTLGAESRGSYSKGGICGPLWGGAICPRDSGGQCICPPDPVPGIGGT